MLEAYHGIDVTNNSFMRSFSEENPAMDQQEVTLKDNNCDNFCESLPCRLVHKSNSRFQISFLALSLSIATLLSADRAGAAPASQAPQFEKSDRYVECLLGYDLTLIYKGMKPDPAEQAGLKHCAGLEKGIPDYTMEAIGDHVHELLFKVTH